MSEAEEPSAEPYGTVREAAAAYGISERAIIKRLSAGSLLGHRLGKVWRVKLPELSAELSERRNDLKPLTGIETSRSSL